MPSSAELSTPESRLAASGQALPDPPAVAGLYAPVVQVGDILYLSGHISHTRGKIGADLDEAAGRRAAEDVAWLMLATLRRHLGTLDRVRRIVKVTGLVHCTPEFTNIPQVINGFSQTMLDIFGEGGRSARSAFGAVSLPLGVAVEVEAIVQIQTESAAGSSP